MIKKSVSLITILLLCLFSITGCWSKMEIDKKTIIAGFGIDKVEDKKGIKITVQAVLPEEVKKEVGIMAEEEEKPVWMGSSTGSSLYDAAKNLVLTTGSKILWDHSQVLVIGEEIAKNKMKEITDWLERSPGVRRRIYVLVTQGEAEKIIKVKNSMDNIPVFNISKLMEGTGSTSKAPTVDLKQFLGTISSKTTATFLPVITTYKKVNQEGKSVNALKLDGSGIFKDFQLIGWMNPTETRGMLWVLGEVKGGILDIECLLNNGSIVSLEILKASGKIKPEIKNGEMKITVEVEAESNIAGTPIPCADITKPENIDKMEKRGEEAIKREIEESIKKAKELNADIFGFGDAIHKKYPKEWKKIENKWDEIFPELPIEVKVNAKIRRTGLITRQTQPK